MVLGSRSGTFQIGVLRKGSFQVSDLERSRSGSWGGGGSRFLIRNVPNLERGGTRVSCVTKKDTQVCITRSIEPLEEGQRLHEGFPVELPGENFRRLAPILALCRKLTVLPR